MFEYIRVKEALCCDVWVMECDSFFRKLFTIRAPIDKILRFIMSGEPIADTQMHERHYTTLDVCEPCSQHINDIGISGNSSSFAVTSYVETLLLLDRSDSIIHVAR